MKIISVRKRAYKYKIHCLIFIYSVIVIALLFGFYFNLRESIIFSSGIIVGVMVYHLAIKILEQKLEKYRRYNQGSKGEKIVGQSLKELVGFLIVNDVQFRGMKGNIDHVVIGENGIFLIETKSFKGNITCDGDEWNRITKGNKTKRIKGSPSSQVRSYTYDLKDFFKTNYPKLYDKWINSIVVFASERLTLNIKHEPKHCKIIETPEKLVQFIKNKKPNPDIDITTYDLIKLEKLLKKYSTNSKLIK